MNKQTVLRLNGNYMRIGWCSPADAFVAMCGGNGSSPALALDIEYEKNVDGSPNYAKLTYATPCSWEEWVRLPIRFWDDMCHTQKLRIRIPTILICQNYKKMPMKQRRPTKSAILDRDGWLCCYTGQQLTNKTASIDHYHPKSRGGRDTWENLFAAHKLVNARKGNRTAKEVGLPELRSKPAPKSIPLCAIITEDKSPDHQFFK